MQSSETTAEFDSVALREWFLSAPGSETARATAIVVSTVILIGVLALVRSRRLREEYTPIWVLAAVGMMVVSIRMDLLQALTRLVGAWTPSSAILFFGLLFLVLISLNFSVRFSRQVVTLKNLVQENALLKERLERLERAHPAGGTDK